VVFVHGLVMDNLSSWYFTVAGAAAARADVVLYDLRGHGRSERPSSGYGLADMVLDLDALLDALAIPGPVVLVGNSFGGLLALVFAIARTDRTAGWCWSTPTSVTRASPRRWPPPSAWRARRATSASSSRSSRGPGATASASATGSPTPRGRWCRHVAGGRHARHLAALVGGAAPGRGAGAGALRRALRPARPRRGAPEAAAPLPRRDHPGCTHSVLWEATDVVRDRIVAFLDELG
jgi:pimeloyl-ACP methyl ester carboxylesterase